APGDEPPLIVLELTRRCGRQCEVCFHRDMRDGSLAQADMPLALARRAIGLAARAGARRVRLTGGEPLRHEAFARLLREIRDAGLEAWVNTAGLPEGGTPWELLGSAARDVLLPLRDHAQREQIADGVRAIRRGGPARVRLGVVLTRQSVAELSAIVGEARELRCLLEAYRIMTVPGHVAGNTADDVRAALEALDALNRWFPPESRVRIANAVPFCVTPDRRRAARNCFGARFDDGRSRLVVSPEGEIRPGYALRLGLGHLEETTFTEAWRHPALLELHAAASLPAPCRACPDLPTCRGGSRHEARLATGSLRGMDPLASHPPAAPGEGSADVARGLQ
ncbi:MAG: radical SAM protein, partial [Deltaproteobacteria bacterium]|nr:radical SAM protein [Deltaproteobacteria bacterium]